MSTPAPASLPPNNTETVFVDYTNSVASHTFQVRVASGSTPSSFDEEIQAFLEQVGARVCASTITAVRVRAAGSHLAFPVASSLVGDTFGSDAANPELNASAMTFVGRSPGGSKARVSIFGFKAAYSNYRLTSTEDSAVAGAVAALNAATDAWLAIDGQKPVWYAYADIKANDYWVRRARG